MKKTDFMLGLLVAAVWGANFSVIKLGLESLDPFMLTALRFLFCAIPVVFFIKRPNLNFLLVAFYGLLFGAGLWGVVNLSIYLGLSAGLASLMLQFTAFITIIMSRIVFHETIKNHQKIGMAIAIAGLVAICLFTGGEVTMLGVTLIMLAALSWSCCNMILKKYKPTDMLSFVIWSGLFATIPLFFITYLTQGADPFVNLLSNFDGKAAFSVIFQAYITTVCGYYIWNNLMSKYEATLVAPLSLCVPVFGLLTSYLVFDEQIQLSKILSAAVIMLGITIVMFGHKLSIFKQRSNSPEYNTAPAVKPTA